jgi:hypothetical protein
MRLVGAAVDALKNQKSVPASREATETVEFVFSSSVRLAQTIGRIFEL